MSVRARLGVFWAVIALVIAAGVVVSVAVPRSSTAVGQKRSFQVNANTDNCGSGWSSARAGTQTFRVTNTTIAGIEVYVQNVRTKAVYLDLENIGTGASASGSVTLGPGTYRFVCVSAESDPVAGPSVTVTGSVAGLSLTPGIVPVTRADLIGPAKAYTAWVETQLPVLAAQAAAVSADVSRFDLAGAKRDWLTAHETYETLGAAYGAFGTYDAAINGTPASGQTALSDPGLTGFHKIEALLWSGAPAPTIAPYASRLIADVAALQVWFRTAQVDPQDIGLRAHEILENALQFELTARTDAGSGTNLATIDANLNGTAQALNPLRGILASRDPNLTETDGWLARSASLVESYRRPDGSWTPLSALTLAQRQGLNATIDQTVELLADVAAICDERRAA
ncbi:MAG: iron uptake system component EfeO [Microbacteriaceae bacterium]|jgi:iron uptake system component EfeO|nr:iron uptake system component EfeO [Microbacteriaceae bacterium]